MDFQYLIDKVNDSIETQDPFRFVYIENFFKESHFKDIISSEQISVPKFLSTEDLILSLINVYDYKVQPFPGCTTDVENYLHWINTKQIIKGINKDQDLIEGFGITLRLKSYRSTILKELIDFFNSVEWHSCLKEKFQKNDTITSVDTAIQKYLSGYEISPHPDIRRKCLTYMININSSIESENIDIHTHFLEFISDKTWVYDFWEKNLDIERCWTPWSWTKSKFIQQRNNSITIFSPSNNTLHGVKLNYDHCLFQRTQFYGNLWYDSVKLKPCHWTDLKKEVPV